MAKGYFRIPKGLELDAKIQVITGSGVPGASGDSTTALVGSFYSDYTNAKFYKKHTAGSGTNKWVEIVDKDYVDSVVAGISWREPAKVLDSTLYANIAAAETAANVADTVNGITIVSGDRLLFTNLTTGNDNVYIVSGSTGAWTFTEDPFNTATDGDAIMIEQGTSAEDQYAFNGTAWVRIGGSLNNLELGYIRDFIGKDAAGIEMPEYTEENFITDGDDLQTAIDKLDIEIGANVVNGNWILAANDVNENITALDNEIGANVTSTGYILSTNSVNENIQDLNDEFYFQSLEASLTGVTTIQTLDSIPVAGGNDVVKWIVRAYDATNSKWFAGEILAMHDGAGNTDLTVYGELRIGSGQISGLDWDVDVSGGNIRLRVVSIASVDVRSKRVAVL